MSLADRSGGLGATARRAKPFTTSIPRASIASIPRAGGPRGAGIPRLTLPQGEPSGGAIPAVNATSPFSKGYHLPGSVAARGAMQQVLEQAQHQAHPLSFLSIVNHVLSVPVAAVSGWWKGESEAVSRAIKRHTGTGDLWDRIGFGAAPWEFVEAIGAGFKEIPEAVGKNYDFTKLLKDRNNPNSWFYQHAKPVGLTMDIVLDPTNYVSFGATTSSKVAARSLWAHDIHTSISEARNLIKAGAKNPETGQVYGQGEFLKAVFHQHVRNNRPFTFGDALAKLYNQGDEIQGALRAGEAGRIKQARAIIAPWVRPGAGGIRFAGMELPGTAVATDYVTMRVADKVRSMAAAVRGKPHFPIEDLIKYNGGDLLPDHVVADIMDDMIRTTAKADYRGMMDSTLKVDINRLDRELGAIRRTAFGQAEALAQETPAGPTTRAMREGEMQTLRETKQIRLKQTDPARAVVAAIQTNKTRLVKAAKKSGINENQIDRLWEATLRANKDPAVAFAEFQWKLMGQASRNSSIDKMLENPLYGYRLAKPTEDPSVFAKTFELGTQPLPKGYQLFKWRGKNYALRHEVHQAFSDIVNPAYLDEEIARFLRISQLPQNWWKTAATVMNPSFHVMNLVGAIWNNALQPLLNPMDYVQALGLMYRTRIESAAVEGARSFLPRLGEGAGMGIGQVPEQTALGAMSRAFHQAAEERGGLGLASQPLADVVKVRKHERLTEPFSLKKLTGETTPQYARRQVRTGRLAGAAALAATGNPMASLLALPEIASAGRGVARVIEDMVRLAPFQKAYRDPYIRSYLGVFGPIGPSNLFDIPFTSKEAEVMFDIGADLSKKFQFDYTKLNRVERVLIRPMIPFWTYAKNNVKLQTAELLKQPRNFNILRQFTNYVSSQAEPLGPLETVLPQYFHNLGFFEIPVPGFARKKLGLPTDEPLFLNPKLPNFAAFSLYPPLWDLFRPTNQTLTEKLGEIFQPIGGSIGPLAAYPVPGGKTIIEVWANRSFGLNRPIDYQKATSDMRRNSYTDAPGWAKYLPDSLWHWFGIIKDKDGKPITTNTTKYILNTMSAPFINNLGQAIPASDSGKARADMVSWLTGIRIVPVDALQLTRGWAYDYENQLESERQDLKDRGLRLTPEKERTLTLLRRQIKTLNYAYDREQTLQGH